MIPLCMWTKRGAKCRQSVCVKEEERKKERKKERKRKKERERESTMMNENKIPIRR